MRRLALAAALLGLVLPGCGSEDRPAAGGEATERFVDRSLDPPWVTALDVDPASGDVLLGTNKGFWRIDPASGRSSRIQGTISAGGESDTVGTFLEVAPVDEDRWLGSGHPDNPDTLPEYLGLIETTDRGRTWRPVSRLGEADLHKIFEAHGRLYAFDAVLGAILVSTDGGETFEERFTPRTLIADFVVDPEDPEFLLAATEDELYRSEDGGRRWRPVYAAVGMRLAWPEPGRLLRTDRDGTVFESTDRGSSWEALGRIEGEPYKLETTDDPEHLYLATSEGAIQETRDGGRTWKAIFEP